MGELTPEKAKAKFSSMKNELIVVMKNWDKNGNGDGTLDESENALIDANDKSNFLNGKSAAILYLWEKSETFNLLSTVVQMLDSDTLLDTAAENDVTSPARKLLSQPSKKRRLELQEEEEGKREQQKKQRRKGRTNDPFNNAEIKSAFICL